MLIFSTKAERPESKCQESSKSEVTVAMVKKGEVKGWHSWAFSCPSHRLQTVPDGPRCDGDEQKMEKIERLQRRRG